MMTLVETILRDRGKALQWLVSMPLSLTMARLIYEYPRGPLFSSPSPQLAVDFLEARAIHEASVHVNDLALDGVKLLIQYDFDSVNSDKLELSFKYYSEDEPGSISTALTCVRRSGEAYEVFRR
jgi:hypothetical protein